MMAGGQLRPLGGGDISAMLEHSDFTQPDTGSDAVSYAVTNEPSQGADGARQAVLLLRLGGRSRDAATVYGALELSRLSLLDEVSAPAQWTVSVIGPGDRIISRAGPATARDGDVVAPSIREKLGTGESSLFEASDAAGVPVSAVAIPSARTGLIALVEVPRSIASTAVRAKIYAIVTGGIASALLAGALLWLFVGNVQRRQEAERQTLRSVAAREMEQRLSYIAADFPGEIFRRVLRPDGTLSYPLLRGRSMDLVERSNDLISGAPLDQVARTYIHSDDVERWKDAILSSAASLDPYDVEWRPLSAKGEERWVRSMARASRTSDGSVFWDGISLDITAQKDNEAALKQEIDERREVERHQTVLIAELNHRVRNTLAIILAIAQQTIRHAADLEMFRRDFSGRIQALAQAHTLLSEKDWTTTAFVDLVREAISP